MPETWPPQPERSNPSERHDASRLGAQHHSPPPPPPASQETHERPRQDIPDQHQRSTRRFGWPAMVAAVALAAVLGGGAGGLTAHYLDDGAPAVSNQTEDSPQLNRTDNVTPTTQAAATASPSVVTLSVGGSQAEGSGSGVILDDQGHILTNTHVVTLGGQTAAADVLVQTHDGEIYEADVVGLDPLSDLAVIKIDAEGLQPIDMGSTEELNVGDQAVAIGAPLGLAGTVTEGIVSNLNRTISVASSAVPEEQETPQEESPFEFRLPDNTEAPAAQGQIHLNVIQSDARSIRVPGGARVNMKDASSVLTSPLPHAPKAMGLGLRSQWNTPNALRKNDRHGEASHGVLGVTIVPLGKVIFGCRIVEVVEDGPQLEPTSFR